MMVVERRVKLVNGFAHSRRNRLRTLRMLVKATQQDKIRRMARVLTIQVNILAEVWTSNNQLSVAKPKLFRKSTLESPLRSIVPLGSRQFLASSFQAITMVEFTTRPLPSFWAAQSFVILFDPGDVVGHILDGVERIAFLSRKIQIFWQVV
jgi:hypothetical protein